MYKQKYKEGQQIHKESVHLPVYQRTSVCTVL